MHLSGVRLVARQRQCSRRIGRAEADIHQELALRQVQTQHQMRLLGQRRVLRESPAYPCHQQFQLVAEGQQQAGEQRVEFEAITTAAALDDLGENLVGVDLDGTVEQHVEVLEGDPAQMRVDQSVETRQTRRTGIVDADMVQVGMGLLGRQRGHGGLRKMASSILDAFSGNTGSAVRHIGPGSA